MQPGGDAQPVSNYGNNPGQPGITTQPRGDFGGIQAPDLPLPNQAPPPNYQPQRFDIQEFAHDAGEAGRRMTEDIVRGTSVAGAGTLSGLTANFDDEIVGFLIGVWPGGPTVGEAVDQQRARQDRAMAESPWLYSAGNLAGAVGTGYGAFRAGISPMSRARPTFSSTVPRAAGEAAIYGTAAGAGAGDTWGERASGGVYGGITGYLTGLLGGAFGQGAARLARNSPYRNIPSIDELRSDYDTLRQTARAMDLTINPNSFDVAAHGVSTGFLREFSTDLAPQTWSQIRALEALSGRGPTGLQTAIDLEDIENVRRRLSMIVRSRSSTGPDAAAAAQVRDDLDDFLFNLRPSDILAGTGDAVAFLAQSRDVYRRLATAERIDEIYTNAMLGATARDTPGEAARAIRNAFANVLKNKRSRARFNAEEQALMEDIVNATSTESVLSGLGNFAWGAFTKHPGRVSIGAAAAGGVGAGLFGTAGLGASAIVPTLGTISGRIARSMAREEVGLLSAAVRGNKPVGYATPLAAITAASAGRSPTSAPGAEDLIKYLELQTGGAGQVPYVPPGWRRVQ